MFTCSERTLVPKEPEDLDYLAIKRTSVSGLQSNQELDFSKFSVVDPGYRLKLYHSFPNVPFPIRYDGSHIGMVTFSSESVGRVVFHSTPVGCSLMLGLSKEFGVEPTRRVRPELYVSLETFVSRLPSVQLGKLLLFPNNLLRRVAASHLQQGWR